MQIPVKKLFLSINVCILLWLALNNFLGSLNFSIPSKPELESDTGRYSLEIEPDLTTEIQPGDILLISGNTFVDKIIKLVTRSPYSHVVGVVNPNQVVEILPLSTARYKKLREYTEQVDVFTCDRLSAEDRRKIVSYITAKVGTSYDYYLIIWEASRYLLNREWPYENKNSSICSTLWTEAYRKAGIDLCPDVKFPVPGDLAKSRYLRKGTSLINNVTNSNR